MSILVFVAVLFSALLHAVWNAYAKNCPDKLSYFVIMSCVDFVLGLAIVLYFWNVPEAFMAALPLILATAVCHIAYRFLLSTCYEDGDLSFVYPISRGSAPLIVAVSSLFFLDEIPGLYALIGILLISVSILSFGFARAHHSRKLYGLALLTGLSIAGYSLFGGLAARVLDSALLAVAYVSILDAPIYIAMAFAYDKRRILDNIKQGWVLSVFGGSIAFCGYSIATWAMVHADVSAVMALRATSVLFAIVIGVMFLRERLSIQRVAAAVVIVAGIALIKVG